MPRARLIRGVGLCTFSALCFAVLPYVANAASDAGVGLPALLFLRFGIAAGLLWLLLVVRGVRLPRPRTTVTCLALGGIGYATQSALYFSALSNIAPSLDTLLLYTFPVLVFGSAVLRHRERASARKLGALGMALAGVAAVLIGGGAGALDPLGVVLGLSAAVAYATYIVIGDAIDPQLDRLVLSALVCTGAAGTYGMVTLFAVDAPFAFEPVGWWWVAVLAVVSTAVAVAALFAGLRIVGASTASIVSCVEPVGTVLIGVAVFADPLGPVQLLGGLAVLAAVIVLQLPSPAAEPREATS